MEMIMLKRTFSALILAALVVLPSGVLAQLDNTQAWASHLSNQYQVLPNVTYLTASNRDNKVDLYLPRGTDSPAPVLVYIHGGGWVGGSKESSVLRLVPWMEMGWAVVNVQYRLCLLYTSDAADE